VCKTITMGTAKLLSRISEADGEDPFTDIEQDKNELGVSMVSYLLKYTWILLPL